MMAITKGSLRAISRSPSAVIFSVAFPFIFILVFGFIGDSGRQVFNVTFEKDSDSSNAIYQAIKSHPSFRVQSYPDAASLKEAMQKGKLNALLQIVKAKDSSAPYVIRLRSATSNNDKWPQLRAMILAMITEASDQRFPERPVYARFDFDESRDIENIREYRTIDFILPGQLGFSLLSSGVFGVAFMFFTLRNSLVLKRFFATPVNRSGIILGEAISRVIFQMTTAVVIIGVGNLFLGFTLIDGWVTFLQMLVLSFLGLVVFMGFGFIISGIARNESSIPPVANIFTLPQFLLGGTFFPIEAFPKWLQPISASLPLTHLNEALRGVAFEGLNLWEVRMEIAILLIWGLAAYLIAVRVFKWE